jgi:hypothetical protein
MKLDAALHKTLLAGLSRAPLPPVEPQALATLLAAVPNELRLWHTIAAIDLWQRAGYLPPPATQPMQADCAPEASCPQAAEQVLQLMLRDIHPELLGSWLAQARTMGFTLPHSCIVPLLDMGMQKPSLRPALAAVLGKRGQWLVAQHPQWAEAYGTGKQSGEPSDRHWQLGNLEQRCEALQAMRRADPAAALLALEQDWAQEPPENRIALLPCLATGLGALDEAFLERALDDKRKEVRTAAQQLLATLPGSQLSERCKARLGAAFTLERKSGFGARLGALFAGNTGAPLPQLHVQLPEACDKAMKRDGIGIQTYHGMGEKAGWLLDMMRFVPPAHWSSTWELAPAQVIAVLADQEFKTALLTGLVRATALSVQGEASPAAIDWFVTLIGDKEQSRGGLNIVAMLLPDVARLPSAEQERIVQRWLERAASDQQAYANALAWAGQGAQALSPALSAAMLRNAQRQMMAAPPTTYITRGNFTILGKVLHCADLAYARGNWPPAQWEHWPQWRPLVDDLMETLQFRHTMEASFLENDA